MRPSEPDYLPLRVDVINGWPHRQWRDPSTAVSSDSSEALDLWKLHGDFGRHPTGNVAIATHRGGFTQEEVTVLVEAQHTAGVAITTYSR